MVTLILVIIAISVLILVHEWGHFYSARKLGVKVEEFGFGFPPKIFSRMRNGVKYSFNLFPFGGFVKIFGEHGEGEEKSESFVSRPAWQRFIILAAGVGMNLVLAWFFFSVGSGLGLPEISDERGVPVSIVGISPASPAERVGLHFGDALLEMRAQAVNLRIETEEDVSSFIEAYRGEPITILARRGDRVQEFNVTPRIAPPEGEGPLGVAMARLILQKTPWYLAPFEGARILGRTVWLTVRGLATLVWQLVFERGAGVAVSGPVGIFFFAQDSRALGASYFLQFLGLLSVNLAVLNFLPIPALDGGRIFFLLIEKCKGKRLNPHFENVAHTVGFVLLIFLMVLVTYKDIAKLL